MASNLQFIKQVKSTSSVSTVDIADVFSDKYKSYKIIIPRIAISGNDYFDMRVLKASDGTADTQSEYDISAQLMNLNTSTSENVAFNQTAWVNSLGLIDSTDARNGGFVMDMYNPFVSTKFTHFVSRYTNYYGAGSFPLYFRSIGTHTVAQSNSGLQVTIPTTEIEINVFGVK